MYNVSIPMALVDFLPVIFFGVSMVILLGDLYNKMGKGAYGMFAAGMIQIFSAGFLKALWKLLYAAHVCDFQALYTMFLPVQSLGFLLAGVGIVMMLLPRRRVMLAVVPPVFSGSVVFIMMMVFGLGTVCTCLSILASKMGKKRIMILLIASFVCSMGMGALSGADFTQAIYNWIEQGINCVGQGLLMAGVLVLHRAGLKEFTLT